MLGHAKKTTNTIFTIFSLTKVLAKLLSTRSCCILLFTLQKACLTRSVILSSRSCSISWHSFSPWHNLSKLSSAHGLPKELFIVVNVVFCCFPSSAGDKGEGERARWQEVVPIVWRSSFVGRRGRVARGKPLGFALPSYAGRVAGAAVSERGREACRPAAWVNRPGCRCPRRYPGLRRPWWPS